MSVKSVKDSKGVIHHIDYNSLENKPELFSGKYEDLENKPTLSEVATTGSYNDLKDKPTIPTKISELKNNMEYVKQCYKLPDSSSVLMSDGLWKFDKLADLSSNNLAYVECIDSLGNEFDIFTDNIGNYGFYGRVKDTSDYILIYDNKTKTGLAFNEDGSFNEDYHIVFKAEYGAIKSTLNLIATRYVKDDFATKGYVKFYVDNFSNAGNLDNYYNMGQTNNLLNNKADKEHEHGEYFIKKQVVELDLSQYLTTTDDECEIEFNLINVDLNNKYVKCVVDTSLIEIMQNNFSSQYANESFHFNFRNKPINTTFSISFDGSFGGMFLKFILAEKFIPIMSVYSYTCEPISFGIEGIQYNNENIFSTYFNSAQTYPYHIRIEFDEIGFAKIYLSEDYEV